VPTALLIRHGRTAANAGGTLAGWTEGVALDEEGRTQVRALADRLDGLPVRRLVTSPLQRCRESAEVLAKPLNLEPGVVEELGECRYGAWTGRAIKDLADEPLWRTVQDHPSAARFPESDDFAAESLSGMQARALAAVRRLDAEVEAEHGPDALWALVSHGDVIKAVVNDAVGAHFDHFQRIVVGPASLTVIRYTARRPFLALLNDGGSDLAWLQPKDAPEVGAGDAPVGGGSS
jgi:2,3-bisphosphoglycerate-dependent phosphoglycerate mutase